MVSLLQSLHTTIIHDRIITLTRAKNGIRICAYLCVQRKSDAFKNNKITSHFMHVWVIQKLLRARLFEATPNIYQHILMKPRGWDKRIITLYWFISIILLVTRKETFFTCQSYFVVKCTHKSMIGYTKMQIRNRGARENTKMSKQIETFTTSIELV